MSSPSDKSRAKIAQAISAACIPELQREIDKEMIDKLSKVYFDALLEPETKEAFGDWLDKI